MDRRARKSFAGRQGVEAGDDMLFLGCDSGATKVEFILVREDATVLAHRVFPGVVLIADGRDVYRTRMQVYVRELLSKVLCKLRFGWKRAK